MNILDRWRVMRFKRELAALMDTDPLLSWETTDDLMNRMCARAERIALLRFQISGLEGEVDVDPEDPDDARVPSSLFCPTTRGE